MSGRNIIFSRDIDLIAQNDVSLTKLNYGYRRIGPIDGKSLAEAIKSNSYLIYT